MNNPASHRRWMLWNVNSGAMMNTYHWEGGNVLKYRVLVLAVEIHLKEGSVLEGHVSNKRNRQTEHSISVIHEKSLSHSYVKFPEVSVRKKSKPFACFRWTQNPNMLYLEGSSHIFWLHGLQSLKKRFYWCKTNKRVLGNSTKTHSSKSGAVQADTEAGTALGPSAPPSCSPQSKEPPSEPPVLFWWPSLRTSWQRLSPWPNPTQPLLTLFHPGLHFWTSLLISAMSNFSKNPAKLG